jgi:hypothetical protein
LVTLSLLPHLHLLHVPFSLPLTLHLFILLKVMSSLPLPQ